MRDPPPLESVEQNVVERSGAPRYDEPLDALHGYGK
jgi:hypothetical protein